MSRFFRVVVMSAAACTVSLCAATTIQAAELNSILQALPFETIVFDANHGQKNVSFDQFGTRDYTYSGRAVLLGAGHLEARFVNIDDPSDSATFSSEVMPAGPSENPLELVTNPGMRRYGNFRIVAERSKLRNNSTYSVKIVGVAHELQGNVDKMELAFETVTFSGQPASTPGAPKSESTPSAQDQP